MHHDEGGRDGRSLGVGRQPERDEQVAVGRDGEPRISAAGRAADDLARGQVDAGGPQRRVPERLERHDVRRPKHAVLAGLQPDHRGLRGRSLWEALADGVHRLPVRRDLERGEPGAGRAVDLGKPEVVGVLDAPRPAGQPLVDHEIRARDGAREQQQRHHHEEGEPRGHRPERSPQPLQEPAPLRGGRNRRGHGGGGLRDRREGREAQLRVQGAPELLRERGADGYRLVEPPQHQGQAVVSHRPGLPRVRTLGGTPRERGTAMTRWRSRCGPAGRSPPVRSARRAR